MGQTDITERFAEQFRKHRNNPQAVLDWYETLTEQEQAELSAHISACMSTLADAMFAFQEALNESLRDVAAAMKLSDLVE